MHIVCGAIVCAVLALAPRTGVGAQQAPPKLKLVQELRIDAATHDLSGVGAVAMLSDGRLVVAEPQDFRVRVFDAAGKEIAKFGRRGNGPGEFNMGNQVSPIAANLSIGTLGDTVWVLDGGMKRFTLMSRDGKLIRTIPQPAKLPGAPGSAPPEAKERAILGFDPRATLSDGSLFGRVNWGRIELVDRPGGGQARMVRDAEYAYATVSPQGDITRVVAQIPKNDGFVNVVRPGGAGSFGSSVPYLEQVYESLAQDGSRFAFGVTTIASPREGKLRIVVISTHGDTLLARDYPFVPTPVTKHTADSALTERMRGYRAAPNGKGPPPFSPQDADQMESLLRKAMPSAASPYSYLTFGTDWSIWIATKRAADGRQFLVLDEKGNPYGTVAIPGKDWYLASASKTVLWLVESDANDVESLVRYRIVR